MIKKDIKKYDCLFLDIDKGEFFSPYDEIENYMIKTGSSSIRIGTKIGRIINALKSIDKELSADVAEDLVHSLLYQSFLSGVYFQLKNKGVYKINKASMEDIEKNIKNVDKSPTGEYFG